MPPLFKSSFFKTETKKMRGRMRRFSLLIAILFSSHSNAYNYIDGASGFPVSEAVYYKINDNGVTNFYSTNNVFPVSIRFPRNNYSKMDVISRVLKCTRGWNSFGETGTGYRHSLKFFQAFPKTVHIVDNYSAKIKHNEPLGVSPVENWMFFFDQLTSSYGTGVTTASCQPHEQPIQVPFAVPRQNMIIEIPEGLPVGYYAIPIPTRRGYYLTQHNVTPMTVFSFLELYQFAFDSVKNYILHLTATNSCTLTIPKTLTFNHGTLNLAEAKSNRKSQNVSIKCLGDAYVNLDIDVLSMPNSPAPGEFRVGLGHGWDSRLTINGKSETVQESLSANELKTYNIESELLKYATSQEGSLNGTAILKVQII